jgi:acetyl esterase/lipase
MMPVSAQAQQKKKKPIALPADVELSADIEYANRNGSALLLDLYRPKNAKGPLPTIVFVHGGGWRNGSKAAGRKQAWIVPYGFALVSINYRLTNAAQWPAQINDCYEAVRWVRRNAKAYGLAPGRVGCWGTSAGAHLAALMGTRRYPHAEDVSSQVHAACDWFGPSELLSMPPNNIGNGRTEADIAKSNGAKLLGATVRAVPKLARDASALDNVSTGDAAFLIMHGDADKGVPLVQSQKLHDKLKATGVDSTLIILKGAGHGGAQFSSDASQKAVAEFFAKNLKPQE